MTVWTRQFQLARLQNLLGQISESAIGWLCILRKASIDLGDLEGGASGRHGVGEGHERLLEQLSFLLWRQLPKTLTPPARMIAIVSLDQFAGLRDQYTVDVARSIVRAELKEVDHPGGSHITDQQRKMLQP